MPLTDQAANPPSAGSRGALPHWPKVAASAAIFRGDQILIGLRGKDPRRLVWSLPGGHIEPGEPARDAARREVREETGIEVELLGLVDINDVIMRTSDGGLRAHYLLTIFYGRWVSGEPAPADDCLEARFVDVEEISSLPTTDNLMHFIRLSQRRWQEHCAAE
jgi:ADP-ribose pyrophosphatase YjhB (NUDIX family)